MPMSTLIEPKLIAGNSNRKLSEAIARRMSMHRGKAVKLVDTRVERFNDGEIFVEVYENVRGEDMFILQSTSNPANDNLMELLIMSDALRRSSAKHITAVIPYFGYARQDRRTKARTPISAKLVANLLVEAGIERVLTMDLHAAQIQGFEGDRGFPRRGRRGAGPRTGETDRCRTCDCRQAPQQAGRSGRDDRHRRR
jgi:ribose-phosphate pyrophosphokinase